METPAPRKAHRIGTFAVAMVMGAGLIGALAPAALAQQSNNDSTQQSGPRHRSRLTDAQKACLEQHGVQKPAPGANGERPRPTDEQRAAFRAAAQACGIELPVRPHHPRLTDAQKACLEQHGVQKPAPGANGERPRPTDEQRAAFRAAAQACGINLPDRPPAGSDNSNNSNAT